jgi:uncharacterized membrane protein
MKKGFALSFITMILIVVLVGIIILFVFLGKEGHLTNIVSKIPELFNQVLGEIEKRSPLSNSMLFLSNINSAYTFAKSSTYDEVCFFELSDAQRRMIQGYVSLEQKNNEIEISLKSSNNSEPSKLKSEGKICIVEGNIVEELSIELDKRDNWLKRRGMNLQNKFTLNNQTTMVNSLNITIGQDGADNPRWDPNQLGAELSNYMMYWNGEICFIPISKNINKECKVIELQNSNYKYLSKECLKVMSKLTC